MLDWQHSNESSMTCIRGIRCIEREKDNLKNGGEVKRLKKFSLALTHYIIEN